jgi:hypothetical protein
MDGGASHARSGVCDGDLGHSRRAGRGTANLSQEIGLGDDAEHATASMTGREPS